MNFLQHFSVSWHKPITKNLVNVIFWTFLLFGIYFLSLARESSWEYPRYQGVIAFVSAFFIVLPLVVYRSTRLRRHCRKNFLYVTEALIAIPLSLNGIGALYFFDVPWEFDSFIHFLNEFLAVLLIFFVLGAAIKQNTIFTRTLLFFLCVGGAFLFGIVNEGWEFFSDLVFHTRVWGQLGQDPWYDTAGDVLYDALGSGVGALFIFFWGREWLFALRRASPKIRSLVRHAKDRVQDNVREHIVVGTKKLRDMKTRSIQKIQTTKERLRRRSRKVLNRTEHSFRILG